MVVGGQSSETSFNSLHIRKNEEDDASRVYCKQPTPRYIQEYPRIFVRESMSRSRGISQKVFVIGIVAVIAVAGLAVYFVQPRNNGSTTQTEVSQSSYHEGSIDLSKLPVYSTQGGSTYYVVPLNLTINYNMSLYSYNGAEFAVPEYVILNYSWASSESLAPTVQLGITVQGGSCTGSANQGSIYAVVSHIVTVLVKATAPSTAFAGTFAYSYDLVKVPMVTTVINNGQPVTTPARIGPPFELCLPSTQAVHPDFTYPLQAPTIGGYDFQSWKGSGPGSYSGPSANITITITGNVTESAGYA